jgi:type IV secretory pathway VirJ component
VARHDRKRIQCFYGEEEKDSICPSAELAGIEVIKTKGGHHFDGDYRRLAEIILNGAKRRMRGN